MEAATSLVVESTQRLFADMMSRAAPDGVWSEGWASVEAQGLPLALLSEAQGGFGVSVAEAAQIVRLAGAHAVPLPVGEAMVANQALAAAGLPIGDGMVTLATGDPQDRLTLARAGEGWRLKGIVHRVPWGRAASVLLPVLDDQARPRLALVAHGAAEVATDANLALEPRDTLTYDVELSAASVAAMPEALDFVLLRAAGAAMRCLAIAGAAERALEMTVSYANDRTQFGKSIGKFQAVQQALAVMTEEVAACGAASAMAVEAIGSDWLPIAAAKARCGEAAGLIAATAHQVHGAIGFSEEHELHRYTKRLWSWRDEFGSEAEWSLWIGKRVAQQGADRLWSLITAF